ncbi:MAG: RNA polymerase sigma-54 factor, partial [Candidatus Binatia bacterium]
MALELKQVQKLAQQLVMTPQLQQAIKLLQLSRIELQELISQELQENPVLEEGLAEEAGERTEEKLEGEGDIPETITKPEVTRELSAADKIGTLDWHEYMDTHSNSIHGSLTAEA